MVNETDQSQGASHRKLANGTDIGASAGTAILDLRATDQVSLYVANETNATNIDVEHANLSVVSTDLEILKEI